MRRVLLTGMSGTGKSTVINKLAELGYKTVDTDYGGFTEEVDSGHGREQLWREDRLTELLSRDDAEVLFVSGTARNQVQFYRLFDAVILLSAPRAVLVERLTTRTNNPYGHTAIDRAEALRLLDTIEPLLRRRATLEIDTSASVDQVVAAILEHVLTRAP